MQRTAAWFDGLVVRPPWFLHLVLTLLMVAMPTTGRFGSSIVDDDREEEKSGATSKAGKDDRVAPTREIEALPVREVESATPVHRATSRPTSNPDAAEQVRRGADERRQL